MDIVAPVVGFIENFTSAGFHAFGRYSVQREGCKPREDHFRASAIGYSDRTPAVFRPGENSKIERPDGGQPRDMLGMGFGLGSQTVQSGATGPIGLVLTGPSPLLAEWGTGCRGHYNTRSSIIACAIRSYPAAGQVPSSRVLAPMQRGGPDVSPVPQ